MDQRCNALPWIVIFPILAYTSFANMMNGVADPLPPPSACSVVVTYHSDKKGESPFFRAEVSVLNNIEISVDSWRLSWHFPFEATVTLPLEQTSPLDNVPNLVSTPGSREVVMEAPLGSNLSLLPGQTSTFRILGAKASDEAVPQTVIDDDVPPSIEPANITFQGKMCLVVTRAPHRHWSDDSSTQGGQEGSFRQLPARHRLAVEYAPLEKADGDPAIGSGSAEMLIRLRNTQNLSDVALSAVSMQYWLAIPERTPSPLDPGEPLTSLVYAQCVWATVGCQHIVLHVADGIPSDILPGAGLVLNISFADPGTILAPTGVHGPAPVARGHGLDVVELVLQIVPKESSAALDSKNDYSYLATPLQAPSTPPTATPPMIALPRQTVRNHHIVAYISDELAWGLPPGVLHNPYAYGDQEGVAGGGGCDEPGEGSVRKCSIQAMYCCSSV